MPQSGGGGADLIRHGEWDGPLTESENSLPAALQV